MGPLIDAALEKVDRRHAQLTQLSSDLVDALNLYHTLMREPPTSSYTLPKMQPHISPYPFHNPGPPPTHVSILMKVMILTIGIDILTLLSFYRCLMVCHLLRSQLEPGQVQWGHIIQICRATSTWVLPVCQTWLYPNIFMFNRDPINIRLDIHKGHLCLCHLIKITFLINHRGMFDLFIFLSQCWSQS